MQIERESFPEEEFMYFFDQILWVAEDFIEVVMNEDKEYARKEHSGDRLIRNFSNSKIIKDLKDKYDDELVDFAVEYLRCAGCLSLLHYSKNNEILCRVYTSRPAIPNFEELNNFILSVYALELGHMFKPEHVATFMKYGFNLKRLERYINEEINFSEYTKLSQMDAVPQYDKMVELVEDYKEGVLKNLNYIDSRTFAYDKLFEGEDEEE